MKLTQDDVRKIAHLARLKLTEEEVEKFTHQLSDILDHAKMLDEVDTSGIEAVSQITGLQNITFEDEVKNCEYSDELLEQSPMPIQDNMIKVKNIL